MPEQITIEDKKDTLLNFLSHVQLFENLNKSELETILPLIQRYKYNKNEFINSKDDKDKHVYIVEKGKLMLYKMGKPIKQFQSVEVIGGFPLIDKKLRFGTVKVMESCQLLRINAEEFFDENKIDSKTALKVFRSFATLTTEFLRSEMQTSTDALVVDGESARVEFKSTLRCNLHTGKNDKNIEHSSLKTIAAFLNSNGGTLLIGIADNKTFLGLNEDNFPNEDKMLLHLNNLIKTRMGSSFTQFINTEIEVYEEKEVLRIDCFPSDSPVYLKHDNTEMFYVRTGPSSTELKISELYNYIQNRFYRA